MIFTKTLVLIFAVVFFKESSTACVDKLVLSSVDVLVHKQRNSKAVALEQENFYLLEDYIFIDVTGSNGSQLCEGMIKDFPRLETLTLINANLTLIEPGTFLNVPKLKHLSLSVNQLTRIPKGVFNTLPSLKDIYLSRNQIETIDEGAFSGIPELKAVHLNHNKITQLNGNIFNGSPKVSLIDFSFNLLKTVPKTAFSDLRPGSTVKALNIFLRRNEIAEMEQEFLKELIPVNLYLEGNQIGRVSEAVFSAKEGSTLYFSRNKVVCIADDVIEWIKVKNIIVDAKKNPVDCVCLDRIENMLADGEIRGDLEIDSTLPCQIAFPLIGNQLE